MKMSLLFCIMFLINLPLKNAAAETQALTQQEMDDSVRVDLWYGGWEPDYTKTAYEMMLSYRGIKDMHLFAGYGDAEQVFYDRTKVYAGGYFFYQNYSYFKAFVSQKDYDYPIDPITQSSNPDSSSYDKVPKLDLELSHRFNEDFRSTFTFEIFRPNFFYDPDTTITNYKLSAELYIVTAVPALRTKLYAAMLHDPDPDKTEIKGRDNPLTTLGTASNTNVSFRTSSLFGAAVEYVNDKWELEVKLLENRDLDESYDYSLLNRFIYRLDNKRKLQFDYVYDKFSTRSNLSGQTADVYMASYYQQLSPGIKFGAGIKHIGVPNRNENTAFVYLQFKSGILLQ